MINTFLKRIFPFALQLLAGVAVPLSMAPFDWHVPVFAALAIFLYGLEGQPLKRSFVLGLCFGLGLFGVGASWIFVSIYLYGNTVPAVAVTITALFVLILSLFPALTALILNALSPRLKLSRSLLIFPSLWVGMEWVRGTLFTGFPWAYIGYSQFNMHLSQFAPLGSIWAVSFATALMAALLYELITYFRNPHRKWIQAIPVFSLIILVWGSAVYLKGKNWVLAIDPPLDVALVQGNIEQSMKWDAGLANQILQTYYQLTQSHYDVNLIIWPETAVPWPKALAKDFLELLHREAQVHGVGLITGLPEEATHHNQYYNAIIALGLSQGEYRKQHLVPFGEYVPLEKWLRGLIGFFNLPMSSFISGPINQPPIQMGKFKIAPTICYEIAYPELVRNQAKDADILLTISNDAWFGTSLGPHQHLQIAQFRALETGKFLLRATNTGWTALINPEGYISEQIERFQPGVLRGTVRATVGETPWMTYGPRPVFYFIGLWFIFGLVHQIWLKIQRR
ncbi:MAG: apolipoprotein N-acyltransferase [Gammaproteobacteria bacterium]